jgi:hypothetical protein
MEAIYYVSPGIADQLYAALVGPTGSETLTTESARSVDATVEAGLSNVLGAIARVGGKGGTRRQRRTASTRHVEKSVVDRATELAVLLHGRLPAIEAGTPGLCWYSGETHIRLRVVAGDSMVEVSGEASGTKFSGLTSAQHWVSDSLRNNLIMAAATSPTGTVGTAGLVLPFETGLADGAEAVQAQFIIIGSRQG